MKLRIENVCFSYSSTDVLKGISLTLDKKEIKCIVGPNGSGKSTLVKCIDKLLIPQSGSIFLDEREYARIPARDIARFIGYVPQSSTQLFSASVFDTVLMGLWQWPDLIPFQEDNSSGF